MLQWASVIGNQFDIDLLLEVAGRSDIPIGIGLPLTATDQHHANWVGDYDLADYPGEVHLDGVGALIDVVERSADPVTVIAIGPLANLAAALQRSPELADRSRFVGMHGSIRRGYLGADKPHREYNVVAYPKAAQSVFSSGWAKTITPLDTCGTVLLDGDRFARLRASEDPLVRAIIENHDLWCELVDWVKHLGVDPATSSSPLYDTVAVYLAFAEELLVIEELPIVVDDRGGTLVAEDGTGQPVRCATEWQDSEAQNKDTFLDLLTDRLLGVDPDR